MLKYSLIVYTLYANISVFLKIINEKYIIYIMIPLTFEMSPSVGFPKVSININSNKTAAHIGLNSSMIKQDFYERCFPQSMSKIMYK